MNHKCPNCGKRVRNPKVNTTNHLIAHKNKRRKMARDKMYAAINAMLHGWARSVAP